jgi:class 3 adenylate cyclase
MPVRQSRRTSLGVFGLTEERVERRLAAILAADVAGYSLLMGQDEAGTLGQLRAHRRELLLSGLRLAMDETG